jgi:hypothetical protein
LRIARGPERPYEEVRDRRELSSERGGKMKTIFAVCGMLVMLFIGGCSEKEEVVGPSELPPPLGLSSITGDEKVTLFWWCSNYEDDLNGYRIYYAEGEHEGDPVESIPEQFVQIDSIKVDAPCAGQHRVDIEELENGVTYSFLVVASMDDWSKTSHTSNIIEDTPRAESAGEDTIYAYQYDQTRAGFKLSDFSTVDCTGLDDNYDTPSGDGDIMCERFGLEAGMRAWIDGINKGEVQDIGFMSDWDDADEAPIDGYAESGHSIEVLMGHVYAVKTVRNGDNYYAKIQVIDIDEDYNWIIFKAAYQPDPGNTQYKRK